MTNSQKKALAILLTITFPIWVVPVIIAYILIGTSMLIYASIIDAMDLK